MAAFNFRHTATVLVMVARFVSVQAEAVVAEVSEPYLPVDKSSQAPVLVTFEALDVVHN